VMIKVPRSIVVNATTKDGTYVKFSATATDNVSKIVSLICLPSSGSDFQIGNTTVRCTAQYANNSTSTSSFLVHVRDTITCT
jgi:hypothetical protein